MTLPADTRLNDTEPGGPLTAADFDTYTSPETAAMLIGQDTEFQDTMAMPRRQTMPFEPTWYRGHLATCGGACRQGRDECLTPDACRLPADDSEFGALDGIVTGRLYVIAPWVVIGLAALAAMIYWG